MLDKIINDSNLIVDYLSESDEDLGENFSVKPKKLKTEDERFIIKLKQNELEQLIRFKNDFHQLADLNDLEAFDKQLELFQQGWNDIDRSYFNKFIKDDLRNNLAKKSWSSLFG